MTELARDKLREAKFFLVQALATEDEGEIRYYLSAFLSAARSITFVLRRECLDEEGFEEWYSEKQERMRKDPLCRILKEFRNHVIKRTTVTPSDGVVESTVTEESDGRASIEIVLESNTKYFFQTLPQDVHTEVPDEIVDQYMQQYYFTPLEDLGEEYLSVLGQIITEWEEER